MSNTSQQLYAVADFCLIPMGTNESSVAEHIAVCHNILEKSGLKFEMHGYGTNLEGPWSEVTKAIYDCHAAVHANGVSRIATDIRIGTRTDREIVPGEGNKGKVQRVQEILERERSNGGKRKSASSAASESSSHKQSCPLSAAAQAQQQGGSAMQAMTAVVKDLVSMIAVPPALSNPLHDAIKIIHEHKELTSVQRLDISDFLAEGKNGNQSVVFIGLDEEDRKGWLQRKLSKIAAERESGDRS